MKLALIFNPNSGGRKGRKRLPEIEKMLKSKRIGYTIFVSQYHEHVIKICSSLQIEKYDAIVTIGGDGTNFQALNGLLANFDPQLIPPLGIIPVGSGNSFAMDLNIKTIEDGINAILINKPRQVDVCSFTQNKKTFYFVNLTGFGFVTDVAKTAQHFKFLNDLSYVIGVFYRTVNLSSHHLEMDIDGKLYSKDNCFVEFCNSRYTGGNMLMAPDAKIDDGLMDIIIVSPLSRISLLATLPKIYKGTHIDHPAIQCIKAKKVIIKTQPAKVLLPDGEIFGNTPTTIEVHHKLIRYLT